MLAGGSTNFAAYMASLLPVAWWRMGDPAGSTSLNDSVANEKAVLVGGLGTYTLGSTGLVSGDSDTAVVFNGGQATTSAAAKWALGSGDFSAFIIAKWAGTALACIADVRDSGNMNLLFLFMVNRASVGDVGCEGWNWSAQKINVAGSFNDGRRHVLGLTYEAGSNKLRFYLDGALKQTQVQAGANPRPTASTMTLRIANNYNSQTFAGTTDELAVFNRLLSDDDMAALAASVGV